MIKLYKILLFISNMVLVIYQFSTAHTALAYRQSRDTRKECRIHFILSLVMEFVVNYMYWQLWADKEKLFDIMLRIDLLTPMVIIIYALLSFFFPLKLYNSKMVRGERSSSFVWTVGMIASVIIIAWEIALFAAPAA